MDRDARKLSQFELPFEFQGDPVMRAIIDGVACERCVLDTGAPITTLVLREGIDSLPGIVSEDLTNIHSLKIEQVEFGPLEIRVKRKRMERPWPFAIYLGMEQMRDYCLTMDYGRSLAIFSREPYTHDETSGWSELELFRGRPIVQIKYLDKHLRFVLDTGSDGNWLFFDAQDENLFEAGEVVEENAEVDTNLGQVNLSRALLLDDFQLGGVTHKQIKFLLTNEEGFGGKRTPEDGIIGTGNVAGFYDGLQILDFISMRYYHR